MNLVFAIFRKDNRYSYRNQIFLLITCPSSPFPHHTPQYSPALPLIAYNQSKSALRIVFPSHRPHNRLITLNGLITNHNHKANSFLSHNSLNRIAFNSISFQKLKAKGKPRGSNQSCLPYKIEAGQIKRLPHIDVDTQPKLIRGDLRHSGLKTANSLSMTIKQLRTAEK